MSEPEQLPNTAADDLALAEVYFARALGAGHCCSPSTLALVGIGHALTARVRQQDVFYREVYDLLSTLVDTRSAEDPTT